MDDDPILENSYINHKGGVNRVKVPSNFPSNIISKFFFEIKAENQKYEIFYETKSFLLILSEVLKPESKVAATWSDAGHVYLWDIGSRFAHQESSSPDAYLWVSPKMAEGYALDWSSSSNLLYGNIRGDLCQVIFAQSSWVSDSERFGGHKSSVEDIKWSPTESNVFASCSSDKTVKIWDTRNKRKAARSFKAAENDVNAIAWNQYLYFFMMIEILLVEFLIFWLLEMKMELFEFGI
jgi:WD40 repeat protein